MKKIREVMRLRYERQLPVRDIASACRMGHTAVGEYLQRAMAARLNWPLPEDLGDDALTKLLFPVPAGTGPSRASPDYSQVHRELSRKGVTLQLLWQEYIQQNPGGYGYSRFAELYRKWAQHSEVRMLQRHKAGQKMFVDYAGQTMPVTDASTGEVRQVQVFVSGLGMSQFTFARAYESQEIKDWLDAHV